MAYQSSGSCTEGLVWDLGVVVTPRALRNPLSGWTWQEHRKTLSVPYFHFSSIISQQTQNV